MPFTKHTCHERVISRACQTSRIGIFRFAPSAHSLLPGLIIAHPPNIPSVPQFQFHPRHPSGYPISLSTTLLVKLNLVTTHYLHFHLLICLRSCSLVFVDFWNIIVGRTLLRSSLYIPCILDPLCPTLYQWTTSVSMLLATPFASICTHYSLMYCHVYVS